MKNLIAGVSGMVFGIGLILSGMSNPHKVLAFLDVAGHWDPSLMLVMVGAITVAFPVFRYVSARNETVLGCPVSLPSATAIDLRLISGASLFGIGWGIAGFCPGPAIVALGISLWPVVLFVVPMLVGLWLAETFFSVSL